MGQGIAIGTIFVLSAVKKIIFPREGGGNGLHEHLKDLPINDSQVSLWAILPPSYYDRKACHIGKLECFDVPARVEPAPIRGNPLNTSPNTPEINNSNMCI